ncbi:MAG: lipopolysaccharide heptosyltransferase II [Deltaproteobacteria bacterium]|nr:lipopolysaccharide heptosyltransferase II [Deltaproteobacteria bacterium]
MAERILLIKLSALGDVIQTLPTLEAIRAAHPQAEITWLVEEAAAPVLEDHPALDELLISRRQTWLAACRRGAALRTARLEIRQLVQALRRCPFDLVIDLQGLLKSSLWTFLARSPRKIGFDQTRELSYLALSERLPPYDPDEPAVRRYLRVAQHLGASGETVRFRLALPAGSGNGLEPLWADKTGPLIILHPGTRWETKHWPPTSFAALADALAGEMHARIVFTGSPGDRSLIGRILSAMRKPGIDLSGRTDLKTLAGLFYQADAAVTTDTGPMHLAAAVGAPVVALFGPTAPWRTGPVGCGHRVLRLDLACSPCFRRHCSTPECMSHLEVDDVLTAVRGILRQGRLHGRPTLKRHAGAVDIIDHLA